MTNIFFYKWEYTAITWATSSNNQFCAPFIVYYIKGPPWKDFFAYRQKPPKVLWSFKIWVQSIIHYWLFPSKWTLSFRFLQHFVFQWNLSFLQFKNWLLFPSRFVIFFFSSKKAQKNAREKSENSEIAAVD